MGRHLFSGSFVHPLFDLLIVGGGLSLVVAAAAVGWPRESVAVLGPAVPFLLILSNTAHFAASTVRLYTRDGALARWPFLTLAVPGLALALLTAAVAWAAEVGRHVTALYLTWSPFHYAAQAYGLAVMYTYRAGDRLPDGERILLRWACLLPFLRAFLGLPDMGLHHLLPARVLRGDPVLAQTLAALSLLLGGLSLLAPFAVFAFHWIRARRPLPVIVPCLILSNAVWWVILAERPDNAFLWATIFHGVQYLGITLVFHVRERADRPHPGGEGLRFYGLCLALAYALFQCWPYAFRWAGFPFVQAATMVVAAINIHHFVVDAFIWKIRQDPNAAVVGGAASP